MVGVVTIPTFAAAAYPESNPGSISLYYNLGGGPQRTYDTCRVAKNPAKVYYAECDALINGDLTITGDNCVITSDSVVFNSTGKKLVLVEYKDYEDYTIFIGKLKVATTSKFAQANVEIGF